MLQGKKTYIMALIAVITAIAQWYFGDLESGEALNVIVTAVLAATLRKGIATDAAGASK